MFVFLLFLLLVANAEIGSYIDHNVSLSALTGDAITIHVVGHTHDDPGWLITVDQYYIQEVEWIFYTMIPVLTDNPIRRFTYVEMAYMNRWWQEIDDKLKQDTIKLINNGQLQMNLGGWCMNDEASPTASAVIHQMTDGNQFILNNLGTAGRPTVAWHVDPFGHSWVTGGMWAQSGFDAFAVHRINYLDLERRKANQDLEFIWKGSNSLGEEGYIFFHILDSGYGCPREMEFWNGASWINTDPLLPSYPPNQVDIAESLIRDSRTRLAWYRHNQLLIPFGEDFAHQNAYQSYIQMDKLINYINSNNTYNATILYSSLADYVKAVNDLDLVWDLEQPDFFTYVDRAHAWWSGYFTSRPVLKLYTRSRMNELRVAEQLYLFAKNLNFSADFKAGMFNITFLRDALDVSQHHDAVTGTEKTAVFEEYMTQLSNGTKRIDHWDESVVGQFLRGSGGAMPTLIRENDLISQLTANNFVVMVAYNSLAWNVSEFLQIPANRSDLIVYDSKKNIVKSQINPVAEQENMFQYPNKFNLFIFAENMAPLAFETFFIGVNSTNSVVGQTVPIHNGETFKVGNGGYYTLTMDGTSNRLSTITNNNLGKTFQVEHQFSQYVPSGGIYNDGDPNSGAYIFRPATDNRLRLGSNNNGALQNKNTNVKFRQKLARNASPGFIVQTHADQGQYADTFNAMICGMNTGESVPSFNYQYYRADRSNAWGQKPLLDFLVFDTNNPTYSRLVDTQQIGSVSIPKPTGSASTVKVTITFKNAFAAIPRLFISVRNTACDGKQFVTTISSISANSADVYVERLDSKTAWTNNLFLDYMVYDPNEFKASPLMVQGQTVVSVKADSVMANYTIKLDNNNNFVLAEPVILVSLQQISPVVNSAGSNVYYYAKTTYDSNNVTFGLNLFAGNPSGSGRVSLSVSYFAFERQVLLANVTSDDNIKNVMITGPLMDEVQQNFKNGYAQTFRVFNVDNPDLRFIDNQIHIGPIDQGAEFITKYTTQLSSNNEFYTNQAGLEYVKRVYFPYWDERIAGNYYPSSGATYIDDNSQDIRFSTIVNQGHGVASLGDGIFEMMLQRRCLQDDGRGVGQILNTTYHTEPQVMILMDSKENVANLNRRYYQMQQFKHSFFFGLTNTIDEYVSSYNTSWSAMPNGGGLADNIFLMQLRYAYSGQSVGENGGIVMQLQNMFEINESSLAKNVSIDLNSVIDNKILNIVQSTETNLLSTIALRDLHRLEWNVKEKERITTIRDEESENKRRNMQKIKDGSPIINLKPRDIRTFVINAKVD